MHVQHGIDRSLRVPLARDPRSAGTARHIVATAVSGTPCESVAFTAELLVSELVGNAVRYGSEPVEMDVHCTGRRLEVGVRDAGSGAARLDRHECVDDMASDDLPEGGRGLCLVEDLSEQWGSEPYSPGKRIWFVVSV